MARYQGAKFLRPNANLRVSEVYSMVSAVAKAPLDMPLQHQMEAGDFKATDILDIGYTLACIRFLHMLRVKDQDGTPG